MLFGVPMAMVLARRDFPGLGVLRSLVLLPLVLPPVVGGLALLYTFGRRGLLGAELEVLGIQIAFSTIAVVMAQTFVAMPFLVVSLEGALRTAGQRYEVVAASLGAGPTTVFRRITLPLVLPGLVSGAVLSFARSLGEFGATITFAGSLQGRTRTLPLEIYLQRETDPDAAVALALVLVVVAAAGHRLRPPGAGCAVTFELAAQVEERGVDLAFDVAAGETLAVLGPNGSGKSTALWVTAGLVQPDAGRVVLDGRVLTDVGPGRPGVQVPPHARRTALLGQEPLLFPHLDALENVAFGPRSSGTPRASARRDGPALAGGGRGGRARRAPPVPALRWSGATGRRGAGARRPARAPAARRAAGRAGRRGAARAAADPAPGARRPDRDRGHPRPAGRAAAGGPGRGARGRPGRRAGGQCRGALPAAEPVRGQAGRAQPGRAGPGGPTASRPPKGCGCTDWSTASRRRPARASIATFRPQAVAVFRDPVEGSPRNAFEVTITEIEPLGEHDPACTPEPLHADVTVQAAAELGLDRRSGRHVLGQGDRGLRLPARIG